MSIPDPSDRRLRLTESLARELSDQFGTPLYVLDETILRTRAALYRDSFQTVYPKIRLSYASKANSTLAVLQVIASEQFDIDVASEGELRAAILAGIPPKRCTFHGNNKSAKELAFAIEAGIGEIVIDNFHEMHLLEAMNRGGTRFLLRLAPGVDPITHHRISTGQEDTKFGFNISDGSAMAAVEGCLASNIHVIGFHCHVGSQLMNSEAQVAGAERLAEFAVQMAEKHRFKPEVLNVGGGLGVRYTPADHPQDIPSYCRDIVEAVKRGLGNSDLNPTIVQEPGRSLVAEAGVTLYTVGAVKTVPLPENGVRTYVSVDGSLADNPRPAMYDAVYQVERVAKRHEEPTIRSGAVPMLEHGGPLPVLSAPGAPLMSEDLEVVTICGRSCETDNLFIDVQLPSDIGPGDFVQVLSTGAYNASMASNYNRFPRPATVMIRSDGQARLVQKRESYEQMFEREVSLE